VLPSPPPKRRRSPPRPSVFSGRWAPCCSIAPSGLHQKRCARSAASRPEDHATRRTGAGSRSRPHAIRAATMRSWPTSMRSWIGAGHNGLITAAYLARAGQRTLLLEARSTVGGWASTVDFAGARVNICNCGPHHVSGRRPSWTSCAWPTMASAILEVDPTQLNVYWSGSPAWAMFHDGRAHGRVARAGVSRPGRRLPPLCECGVAGGTSRARRRQPARRPSVGSSASPRARRWRGADHVAALARMSAPTCCDSSSRARRWSPAPSAPVPSCGGSPPSCRAPASAR
jgi:hypothetical protein